MRFIYALYDRAGVCLYVGNSANPRQRMRALAQYGSGDMYYPRPIDFFCGMVLRAVDRPADSIRIEAQVIAAYRRRGQARFNIGPRNPGNILAKPPAIWVWGKSPPVVNYP